MARVESDGSVGGADEGARGRGPAAVLVEVALVALLFAAAGAWPTPDTNEAHYLTRARHGWDPAWLEGDFFLESREAHGVFSFLIGPLAAEWPLGSAAWAGRIAGPPASFCSARFDVHGATLLAGVDEKGHSVLSRNETPPFVGIDSEGRVPSAVGPYSSTISPGPTISPGETIS